MIVKGVLCGVIDNFFKATFAHYHHLYCVQKCAFCGWAHFGPLVTADHNETHLFQGERTTRHPTFWNCRSPLPATERRGK